MSGLYSMSGGASYSGATGGEWMLDALDQPLSVFSTLEESAKGGVLDSLYLGSLLKKATTDAGAPIAANRGESPEDFFARRAATSPITEDQYKTSANYREGIPWDPAMTTTRAAALAESFDAKRARDYFTQKRPVWAFIGGLGGQAVDPINYIPVFGEGVQAAQIARFGPIGGRLLTSAADAALNTGVASVATAGERARFGDDVSWQATLSQMAMAALVGGAFGTLHGIFRARADATSGLIRDTEERLATLKTTQEARIALNEGIDAIVRGEDVNLSPNATEPLQRVTNDLQMPAPLVPTAFEPPVPEGFVRVYHSGSVGEGDAGRWVSTNRQYAADYRPDLPLHYLDLPADDPRVNNADIPEQGVKQGFTFNFETTPKEAADLKEISRGKLPADLTVAPVKPETAPPTRPTIPNDPSLNRTASWVIRDKETKSPVMETFNPDIVDKLNTSKYEAVPIGQYLGEINGRPRPAVDTAKAKPEPTPEGLKQAEASVAKPEDTKGLAGQHAVDPATGAFTEEADIKRLASEGRLTEEDLNALNQADNDAQVANSYGEALKAVVSCLL